MKRRTFIKGSSIALAALGASGIGIPSGSMKESTLFAADRSPLLPIPPLLENLDASGASAEFKLNPRRGVKSFFPGVKTPTMGYNGDFLGPTIRVRNGQRFKLDLKNHLNQQTSLHWHGLHVPAKWEGGAQATRKRGKGVAS